MNVLAQGLNRLRCTYSTLLRLWDKGRYPSRWVDSPAGRNLGALTWSRVQRDVANDLRRRVAMPVVDHQRVADECGEVRYVPEKVRENAYARGLFLGSINYVGSVMQGSTTHAHVTNEEVREILEQDWRLMTNEEMLSAIKRLSYNISRSKESVDPSKYENAFNELCARYQKLSDNDLMVIMRQIVPFYQHLKQCSFYQNFGARVDTECVVRFSQLSNREILLLCDMLYQLTHQNSCKYIWYSIRKLGNKPNKLTPHQLVQVLFFLNICRKPPINMYELEYRLEQCLDELSVNELAIAALGFFKTRTKIRSAEFLNRIMRKTIDDVETVSSVSIGALLKLIRYSMQLSEFLKLQELLKALIPHMSRFTLMSLMHILHVCAKVALYDEEVIDVIIKRFNSELKTARLKDIERLIFAFASFNIDANNIIFQNVVEELRTSWNTRRAQEISLFPHVASRILGYLAVLSIYPTDLIERVMAPEYIHKVSNGNYRSLSREYCVLDYSLRLEVPEYQGPFLQPATLNFLENKYFNEFATTNEKYSQANMLLTSVLKTCQEMFNTTSDVAVARLLPLYAPPDIVLCLDEQNQLVSPQKFLSQFNQSDIKRVDKDNSENVRWIVLVLAPHGLLMRNNNLPTGLLAAKIRQLSIIGYTPITISYVSWRNYRSQQEKCDYIKNLVFKDNLEQSNT